MTFLQADACLKYGIKVMLVEGIGTENLQSLYGKALNLVEISKKRNRKENKIDDIATISQSNCPNTNYVILINNLKVIDGFQEFVDKKARQMIYKQ